MYQDESATQVFNPDDPLMGVEWSVNINDDETRNMRAAEVAFEYLRGALDANDTFVWREGMDDWVPLGQCNELQEVIRQYNEESASTAAPTAPTPAAHQSYDPGYSQPPQQGDLGSTVMMTDSHEACGGPVLRRTERRRAHRGVAHDGVAADAR